MTMVKRSLVGPLSVVDDFDDIFRMFGKALVGFNRLSADLNDGIRTNAISDFREDENKYEIELELPGVQTSEVNVDVNEGILTISVNQKQESQSRRFCYQMTKSVSIPENVSEKDIVANLKAGVLVVTLPKVKAEKREAKKVQVNGE